MKLKLFLLILFSINVNLFASAEFVNNNDKRMVIITGNQRPVPRISEPVVIYNISTSLLSINFGNQPIEDYTVTISSPFTDVDYYVTSSYTTIPLLVDGYSDYTIIIETSDGDVFEGTLAASDYTTTATI